MWKRLAEIDPPLGTPPPAVVASANGAAEARTIECSLSETDLRLQSNLTMGQLQVWLAQALLPEAPIYNLAAALRIHGELSPHHLENAFRTLVNSSDALRIVIQEKDGIPLQRTLPEATCELELVDFSSASDPHEQARRWMEERCRRPLSWRERLFDTALIKLSAREFFWYLNVHHIVCDTWSFELIFRYTAALYRRSLEGRLPTRVSLPAFADYVAHERTYRETARYRKTEQYWQEKLAGGSEPLSFYGRRPALGTTEVLRLSRRLGRERTSALEALAAEIGGGARRPAFAATLAAALTAYLHCLNRRESYTLGIPFHNRRGKAFKETIGFFSEVLPVTVQVAEGESLGSLARRIKSEIFQAARHGQHSIANPVWRKNYEVILNYHTGSLREFAGMPALPEWLHSGHAEESLAVQAHDFDGSGDLELDFDFHRSIFDRAQAREAVDHFFAVLDSFLADAGRPLGRTSLIADGEARRLVSKWSRPAAAKVEARCVHELIEERAKISPDAPALVRAERRIAYGELERSANRLARYLRKRGAGREVPVGLYFEPSVDMVVAMLGILKAGAAYVPLDPAYPREWLAHVLADTKAPIVLTHRPLLDRLPGGRFEAVCLDSEAEGLAQESDEPIASGATGEDLAYVIYTSGSTGAPKGVEVLHRALANFTVQAARVFGLEPADRVLQFASISFDTSIEEIFPCLASGATLVLRDDAAPLPPTTLLERCRRWGITVLDLPTAYWHQLAAELYAEGLALPEPLRLVIIGGERASPERLALWKACVGEKPRIVNTYGPTETTVTATFCDLTELAARCGSGSEVPIGKPIPGVRTYILDGALRPVPPGVPGELYIGGLGLARGYLNLPELTAERFIPDPFSGDPASRLYRTGDLVRYRTGGELEFIGRADRQVKIRGFRVELDGVEHVLRQHPLVEDAVVLPEGEANPKALAAYVVPEKAASLSADELREFARKRLPEYMVPARLATVEALPRTPAGKIDYRALRRPDATAPVRGSLVPPATETEREIAAIWSKLLGVERIGRDDHFFELGGHSLLAAQLVSRLRRRFEAEIPLRAVFDSPTLAALARRVDEARRERVKILEPAPVRARGRSEGLPLSFSQARIWFMHQLAPESSAYNIAAPIRFTGALHKEALRKSLAALAGRHEAIRTTLKRSGGEAVQVVGPPQPLEIPEIDLSELPAEARLAEARRVLTEEARRPFDLERGPLVRFLLVRLDEEDHVLLLTMHHAISDQWSLNVMAREMTSLYNGFCRDLAVPLPEPSAQYADFALWQNEQLTPERVEAEIAYWRERLSGVQPLAVPSDRPRPPVQTFRGAHHSAELPKALVERLQRLGLEENATLYMVFLAAFKALLRRYTGRADIAVGAPVANRNRVEWEGVVGTFINIVVLRTDLSDAPTFRALLAKVRETALEAFEHQELPFERLVEALEPDRDPSRPPLVQVLFNFQQTPAGGIELLGVSWAPFEIDQWAAQFDLAVTVDPEITRKVFFSYNTDLYDRATIERLAAHYLRLLEGAAENPDRPLAALSILSEGERRQLLIEWNDTRAPHPELCVHELFEAQARKTPDSVAVICGDRRLTYRALDERADRVARRLRARGVGPGTGVGVCLERSPELLVGLLGILKAGAPYVPIDPAYPAERKAFILGDSGARVVLTERGAGGELPDGDYAAVSIEDLDGEEREISVFREKPTVEPGGLAYVIYTSGSTGRPKGVEIEHRSLVNFLLSMARRPGLASDDLLLSVTTISFDIAALELFLPLAVGASVALVPRRVATDGARLIEAIEQLKPTVMQATPATWRMLVETGWRGLEGLKILCGGEALTPELARALLDRGASVWNLYGPTETTVWSTLWKVEKDSAVISIGKPIDNTRVYVLDENLEPVPLGVTGELYIGGRGVARGYRGRPDLTAERFVADPFSSDLKDRLFRTGDLACYLPDGNLLWMGRRDQQVKIRGHRVEPGEIESALEAHPSVKQAVVVARDDEFREKRLVAYVLMKTPARESEELRRYLAEKLPAFMVPSRFVFVDALPMTPNGKVNRAALSAPDGAADVGARTPVAPRNRMEARLKELWERTLGVKPIGVRDNFFEIGGHSLLAAKLLARIEKLFEASVSLNAFLAEPTIERLASLLANQNGRSSEWSSLVPLQPSGSRPPFFWVHGDGSNFLLPKYLGPDQPLYGFLHQCQDGQPARYTRVETIAAHYLSELRSVQPEGPYFLGGYSFGGLVAFEIARQLERSGERVALLALLEPTRPGDAEPPVVERKPRHLFASLSAAAAWFRRHGSAVSSLSVRDGLAYISERLTAVVAARISRLKLKRRLKRLACEVYLRARRPLPPALRGTYLGSVYLHAARTYSATPYSGSAVIFCGRSWSEQALSAWRKIFIAAETVVIETDDLDHTEIVRELHVASWAPRLRACLEVSQSATREIGSVRAGARFILASCDRGAAALPPGDSRLDSF